MYLDNASTTKPFETIIEKNIKYLKDKWQNPSSLSDKGESLKKDLDSARKTIADFIGATEKEIIFTSGASESNSSVIKGFIENSRKKNKKTIIITSKLEHESILNTLKEYEYDNKIVIHYLSNDKNGLVDLVELENLLSKYYLGKEIIYDDLKYLISLKDKLQLPNVLVSIQITNNETGVIQDIQKIGELVRKYKATLHTDATQAFGKIKIDVKKLNIHYLSASGHKIHAPKGIGILYKSIFSDDILPLINGNQEFGFRGGTENVFGIMCLKDAIKLINKTQFSPNLKLLEAYDCYKVDDNKIMTTLKTHYKNKISFNGNAFNNKLSNIINIRLNYDISVENLMYYLEIDNIYISLGSACSKGKESHVLKAMGLTPKEIRQSFRLSLSDNLFDKEIETFIKSLDQAIKIQLSLKGEQCV